MHPPARHRRTPALLLASALAASLLTASGALAGALEVGSWKVIAAERAGQPNPAELDARLSFAGGTLTIVSPEGGNVKFEYTLDRSQEPDQIDLTRGEGDKRLTLFGIWKIEGAEADSERFTLCIAEPFSDRPTEFATAAGQRTSLTVHERTTE